MIGGKIDRPYIEKNFDKLVSPYMDINYFQDGGPNNVKDFLIDIMTRGYIKYQELFDKSPQTDELLAFSFALKFDLLDLFRNSIVSENTGLELVYPGYDVAKDPSNVNTMGVDISVFPFVDDQPKLGENKKHPVWWGNY